MFSSLSFICALILFHYAALVNGEMVGSNLRSFEVMSSQEIVKKDATFESTCKGLTFINSINFMNKDFYVDLYPSNYTMEEYPTMNIWSAGDLGKFRLYCAPKSDGIERKSDGCTWMISETHTYYVTEEKHFKTDYFPIARCLTCTSDSDPTIQQSWEVLDESKTGEWLVDPSANIQCCNMIPMNADCDDKFCHKSRTSVGCSLHDNPKVTVGCIYNFDDWWKALLDPYGIIGLGECKCPDVYFRCEHKKRPAAVAVSDM